MHKVTLALALSLGVASAALAATDLLVKSWFADGKLHCQYSSGSIIVGGYTCPTSIQR